MNKLYKHRKAAQTAADFNRDIREALSGKNMKSPSKLSLFLVMQFANSFTPSLIPVRQISTIN